MSEKLFLVVAISSLVYLGSRLDAQDRISGFGPVDGRRRIAGFGSDAELLARVNDVDRSTAAKMMAAYDRNRDAMMDGQELRRARFSSELIRQHDRNGDGRISLDEEILRWTKARLAKQLADRQKAPPAKQPSQQDSKPDSKQDSKQAEPDTPSRPVDPLVQSRTKMCVSLANEIIAQHDRNANKQLEISEWREPTIRFRDLGRSDTNGDRLITQEELTAWLLRRLPPLSSSRLAKPLRLLDSDGDGQITMPEYEFEWIEEKLFAFRCLDKNDDGIISAEESHSAPIPAGAIRFASNAIRVINQRAEVSSSVWVDDDVVIEDLDVLVAMTKQNDHQTQISLVGPDQQSVTLFAGGWQPWSGASLFESTLIDDDATLIETTLSRAPFPRRLRTDALKTDQPGLLRFYGKSARGSWRLVARNQDDGVGVLHHWSLLLTPKKD